MRGGNKKVIVNGKPTGTRALKKIISAMGNSHILVEKGGYLFKAVIRDDVCHLGILPCQIEGVRTHHYEIEIPEDDFLLTGFINANASVTLLFKLTCEQLKNGLTPEAANGYRTAITRFAQILIKHKFPPGFAVDEITQDVLKRIGWQTTVTTVEQLCEDAR